MIVEKILLLTSIVTMKVTTLPLPSYVSEWKTIKSQNAILSEITFNHNLTSWPIKVYTEVKVQSNGIELIFPGMGTAQTDDDRNYVYGQVLTLYDDTIVKVIAPNRNNHASSGVVIYTGTSGWFGPDNITRIYVEAQVRVKVWKREDFPDPDFETSWAAVSINDNVTYKEVKHNISGYPSFTVIQVNSSGYIYEGQGSASRLTLRNHGGGLIYGFSKQYFRIWYPSRGHIFLDFDGWGDNVGVASTFGEFRIIAWKFTETSVNTVVTSKHELIQNNYILPLSYTEQYYINTEVEAVDGYNAGFRFYGVGSTVNDFNLGAFGGLIYSYTTQNIMFWLPNNAYNGSVINIAGDWGPKIYHQTSDNVAVRINKFPYSDKSSYMDMKVKYTTYEESSIHTGILPVDSTLPFTATTYLECATRCSSDDLCESFFYHRNDKICVGYKYSVFNSSYAHLSSAGMQHFIEIKSI